MLRLASAAVAPAALHDIANSSLYLLLVPLEENAEAGEGEEGVHMVYRGGFGAKRFRQAACHDSA